ncbi:hypothetical protein [Bradyrhizobium cenepequi]|uniref:hypothetical protein n=1 Tax=Bradyrhizobium cenepequi TaxID=2821403 RepID=UPI001CE2A4FA|nr:hypothetical protein [Bradyrhizobium cenepequi]MCA6105785.1 hypothetical protein [Bradyrhizobium cenepequi]
MAALARLRRERERRALQELAALHQREAEAALVRDAANRNLEAEKHAQRASEDHIYRSLPEAGPLPRASLERHRETIRRLGVRVGEAAHRRDAASHSLLEASKAVEAGRARLTVQTRDRRKWEQIETRTQTAEIARLQMVQQRESEDDVELRYGRLR